MNLFSLEEVQQRLQALDEYHIMDTGPEEEFNHIAQLAADICETPISAISLLDDNRQWFKATVGFDAKETPIAHSFCAHAVAQKSALVVPDAILDGRFVNNPLVTDDMSVRFYAGAPIINRQGISLGAICAIDQVPRELDPHQIECLGILANKIVDLLEVRKTDQVSKTGAVRSAAITSYQHANARLNKSLRLIESIAGIIDGSTEPDSMVMAVLNAICMHTGWSVGHAWLPSPEIQSTENPEHTWHWGSSSGASIYRNYMEANSHDNPSALLNRAMDLSTVICQPSLEEDITSAHSQLLHRLGFKSGVAVSVIGTNLLGALEFYIHADGVPDRAFTDILECAGHLLGRALEREAERRKTQKSEAYFRHLTEDSLDLVTILDADGTIRFESRSSKDDLGWDASELIGRNAFEFVHPEDAPNTLAAFQESLRGEGPTALLSFRFRHKDGSYRVLEGRGNNLLADPAVSGIVFTSRDITEKKRLESQFGELAGGIAHDFNNLLTVVVGYSSAVETNPAINPKLHNALTEIRVAAERAASLTGQLLAFSGRQILQPRNIQLDTQLVESKASLDILLGNNVLLDFEAGAPGACIHADPIQLDTVLLNLALNGREAMLSGGRLHLSSHIQEIVAGVEAPVDLPPGKYAAIAMRDNGCGMSFEVLSRVFEPYFTTKARGKGTGLGLATCQGIIRQSRGKITVASEPNFGSTFTIYLPVVEARALLEEPPVDLADTSRKIRTILFAEDEDSIRELGNFVMQESGYKVISAANGQVALDLLDADPSLEIDLLLTDIMMPVMGGKELAEEIRRRLPRLPIIFCSGYAQDASFYDGLPERTQLLAKPYTVHAMLDKLSDCFKVQH